jgi:exportin-2 (importin alpha re-exporter)
MPVMKADAIKYIVTFRSVLPPQVIVSTLPALTKLLEAESVVVRIYAAAAIDKILLLKQPDTKTPVSVYLYISLLFFIIIFCIYILELVT